MSDKTYTLPGMADWKFNFTYSVPKILHKSGAYFVVTPETTPAEIAAAVKNILRTKGIDDAEIEGIALAALNIDWQAMLVGPYPAAVAPLINPSPTIAVQKADNAAAIAQICANLETAYYAVKKL